MEGFVLLGVSEFVAGDGEVAGGLEDCAVEGCGCGFFVFGIGPGEVVEDAGGAYVAGWRWLDEFERGREGEVLPALSPITVIRSGSPPNLEMCSWIHSIAYRWSWRPALGWPPWDVKSGPPRKPNAPRR